MNLSVLATFIRGLFKKIIRKMKQICVIDGQGGGIGSAIIKRLKSAFEETIEIVALGTNAIATAQMLKSGANRGASVSITRAMATGVPCQVAFVPPINHVIPPGPPEGETPTAVQSGVSGLVN